MLWISRNSATQSPEFWQTHGKPETPEDLQHLPFLRYENLRTRHSLAFHRPDGASGTISPPQRVRASNGDFLAQMAVAGLGFMVEPEFITEPYLQTGELVEVLCDHSFLSLNLYAVFPPGRRPTRRRPRGSSGGTTRATCTRTARTRRPQEEGERDERLTTPHTRVGKKGRRRRRRRRMGLG